MTNEDLAAIREINVRLLFAEPIARTTTTVYLVSGDADFDPLWPRVGDLVNVVTVTTFLDCIMPAIRYFPVDGYGDWELVA